MRQPPKPMAASAAASSISTTGRRIRAGIGCGDDRATRSPVGIGSIGSFGAAGAISAGCSRQDNISSTGPAVTVARSPAGTGTPTGRVRSRRRRPGASGTTVMVPTGPWLSRRSSITSGSASAGRTRSALIALPTTNSPSPRWRVAPPPGPDTVTLKRGPRRDSTTVSSSTPASAMSAAGRNRSKAWRSDARSIGVIAYPWRHGRSGAPSQLINKS